MQTVPPFQILAVFVTLLSLPCAVYAQQDPLSGRWLINQELSDDTDDKVEMALQASGFEVSRGFFNNDAEYYRGGPPEQELYDYISYEKKLEISLSDTQYTFTYGDFIRPVYLDDRRVRVSLSNINEVEDFSFADWNGDTLLVEARPRDGGFTEERYRLSEDGQQLTLELYLQPNNLSTAVELRRVYDRVSEEEIE
jgi:hypothetical protein